MLSVASTVGGLSIPVPAGVANAALQDPPVAVLLDYFGYWLRESLNAKLANIGAPVNGDDSYTDACPTANRFPYNPEVLWTHNPRPALYIWWDGRSQTAPHTILCAKQMRELHLLWIYGGMKSPSGQRVFGGLPAAVSAVLHKAADRGAHPSFGNGAAVYKAMGVIKWTLVDTQVGAMSRVPTADTRPGGTGDGTIADFFPAVRGRIAIEELIGADTMTSSDAHTADDLITIQTNEEGDAQDLYDYAEAYVENPPEQ